MFARLSRSWTLVKASASVLNADKELLVFPLVSMIALGLVVAAFALPIFGLGVLDGMTGGEDGRIQAGAYVVAFLFYFCQYFVIFFFNSALVGAAMMRLDGGSPTLRDGLRVATSKIGVIAGYAFIAATVGMILRAIQERVGFIGKIIVGLLGVGWTIATFMVVPVLVTRDVGPIDAIKESAALLKKTWGENVIGQAGLGLAFGLIFLGVILCRIVLFVLAIMTKSIPLIVIVGVAALLAVAMTALIQAALAGIYSAALYRYATTGKETLGFDAQTLQAGFSRRSKPPTSQRKRKREASASRFRCQPDLQRTPSNYSHVEHQRRRWEGSLRPHRARRIHLGRDHGAALAADLHAGYPSSHPLMTCPPPRLNSKASAIVRAVELLACPSACAGSCSQPV
jgi:hypothetical protein